MTAFDTMLDLLDHGCDGEPRWVALEAADADGAAALARLIAREAERRGYLPVAAERFATVAASLPGELRQRTFALLQTCAAPAAADASPLVAASLVNPRPHVLVTIAVPRGGRARPVVVREARSVYAPAATDPQRTAWSGEAAKHLARAERGFELAQSGRHSAALRLLRDAAAALARRREPVAAARAGILLGRVLLERGRTEGAERAFAEAGDQQAGQEATTARIWLALARTDAGRLTEAEALLRATKLTGGLSNTAIARWADAALARCLVWQERPAEAGSLMDAGEPNLEDGEPFAVVATLATSARVRLALGRLFEAGQHARAGMERAVRSGDPLVQVVAETAHLRVLSAAGDVDLAEARKSSIVALSRRLHAPLRALRAHLIWIEMLRRAGRLREADRELVRIARLAAAAPPLLRRSIDRLNKPGPAVMGVAQAPPAANAILPLLRAAQEEDEDRAAVQKVLDRLGGHVRAARVELQSAAGGAPAALVTSGSGLAPRLGERAIDAGILIGPERVDGAWEVAAPVRTGSRLLAALACRWPLGRNAHPAVHDLLDLAAAIVAPRVDGLLASRAEVASASLAVPELIGVSDAMADVRQAIARAAAAPFGVLVEGESGR